MKVGIPFGQAQLDLDVDADGRVEIVSPGNVPPDNGAVARSLTHPLCSPELSEFLASREKILVVINDHTRPTPSADVLRELDLKGKKVTTIVAGGAHRAPSQPELEKVIGGSIPPYGGNVVVHDSRENSQLRSFGFTERGTQLQFNSRLFDADGIIVIGSVEPHYFAGYTGGRKFLLPALAGYRSIEMNHSLALDDASGILRLEGNPVHEDLMDALNSFDRYDDIFSIQVVLNRHHDISYCVSGHVVDSFNGAVEHSKEIYVAPIDSKVDIVIAVATRPMDLDLYQSQKAIENTRPALKDGGVLILVSPCADGIGPRAFYDLLISGGDVTGKIREGYRLGYHKAAKLLELQRKARLLAVTGLEPNLLSAISIAPYGDIQDAFKAATDAAGSDSKVLIVMDACLTVPLPRI